jgi:tetratricopeptide (TPR) repeat protein
MRFSLSIPLLGSLLLLGVVPPRAAWAETPSSEAEVESRRERAKLEFKRGSDLFSAGQYQKAVTAFMAADRLAPSAALSFNIALAYEKLADTSGALRWYRDYLRRSPHAPNAATVQARINELSNKLSRGGLQQLTVISTPGGATVMIDGRAVGVTPFTGDLALGQHRLQLDLPGYREPGREIALQPNVPQDLNVAMDAVPPVPNPAKPAHDAGPSALEHDGTRRFGIAPWLVAGGGVVGLGSALGFELARRSAEDAASHAPNQVEFKAQSDKMERHQTTARVLAGVSGTLLVTGTVMLLLNERTPTAPRMGLNCTFTGCTASATGNF